MTKRPQLLAAFCVLLFTIILSNQASALYDPGVGRFCSRDPIGNLGSDGNYYEYCNSSPPKWLDWNGMISVKPWPPAIIPAVPDHGGNTPTGFPPIDPDNPHQDYPILPGEIVPSMPHPDDIQGPDPSDCRCTSYGPAHRMRPPGKKGEHPVPGQPYADCDADKKERVIMRYRGKCSPSPRLSCKSPCEQSACFHYVRYLCVRRDDGRTVWVNDGENSTVVTKCSL